jgi:hypothetical protein
MAEAPAPSSPSEGNDAPASEATETAPAADGVQPAADGGQSPPASQPESNDQSRTSVRDPVAGGDDPSIMEGGGGEEPAAEGEDGEGTPDPSFPDNWREIAAGGDQKTLQYLNRYSSPANVVKALMNLRSRMDSAEASRSRPEGDPDDPAFKEQMNEWRAQVGIPTEPSGYLENVPDGIVLGEQDQEMAQEYVEAMHQIDAPPEYVHQGLRWYSEMQETRHKAEDALRNAFGPEYRPNMNNFANTFAQYGSEELYNTIASARLPDGTLLGDNAEFLQTMVSMSREISPHGVIAPASGQTPLQTINSELESLRTEMRDQNSDYYHSDAKQARYRELLEMKDRHTNRSS